MTGSSEHSNEISSSIYVGKFHDQLIKGSAPWSLLLFEPIYKTELVLIKWMSLNTELQK